MGKGVVKLGEGNWAVKDGNLLAAKETNGRFKNAEFTVTRGTRATYVGRDGLIKESNLQDVNLVNNGDFSELGSELVTNGDFSNWTGDNPDNYLVLNEDANNYVTESNGQLRMVSDNSATIAIRPQPTTMLTVGKTYKVSVDLTFTTGTLNISGIDFNTSGTKVFYLTAGSTYLQLAKGSALDVLIDNVSVQQVDPNDRWSLGTGWSIEDGVAVASNSSANATQETFTIDAAKTYKIDFTISDYGGGTFFITFGGNDNSSNFTANGSYTVYISPTNRVNNIFYLRASGFTGKIDNISVQEIKTDTPRIDFTDNTDGHLLLEPQSTNLIPYSEDFSQSDWVKQTNITPTYNTTETLSPDGTYNATKLVGNGTDGIYDSSLSITGDATRSVYLKSVSGTINVKLKDSNVDIGTETLTVTTEWQRFYLSGDNGTSSQGIWIDDIPLSGVYIFGAQVENLPYSTSYIPTNGGTVTRDAETCTGAGEAADFNSSEGVLYAEINPIAVKSNSGYIGLLGASTAHRVIIGFSANSNDVTYFVVSGTTIANQSYDIGDMNQYLKIALKYKQDDFALWVNGTEVLTDTSGTPNIDITHLGFYGYTTNQPFYGKVKAIRAYKEALSDSELTTLTS